VEETVGLFGFYGMDKCDGESIYHAIADVHLRLNIPLTDCCAVTFVSEMATHVSVSL